MEQLLPYEFRRKNELIEVIIKQINSKIIEDLFKDFKENEPLFFKENLAHLKRVSKKPIPDRKILEKDESFALICLKEVYFSFFFFVNNANFKDFDKVPESFFLKYDLKNTYFIVKVPKFPPFSIVYFF